MEREYVEICVCDMHNKFQTQNGRWLHTKYLDKHVQFLGKKRINFIQDNCDECSPEPYCSVHNRKKTTSGEWISFPKGKNNIESICDVCDDPSQIEIEFE